MTDEKMPSDSELMKRIEELSKTAKEMADHGMIGDSAELLNLLKEQEKRQRSTGGK